MNSSPGPLQAGESLSVQRVELIDGVLLVWLVRSSIPRQILITSVQEQAVIDPHYRRPLGLIEEIQGVNYVRVGSSHVVLNQDGEMN